MNLPKPKTAAGAYDHARHAGNAADVFKHASLVALLERLRPGVVVETHAGRGRYHLGPQGEWTQGIGALLDQDLGGAPPSVARYLELLDARPSKKGVRYLGSPALARRCLPEARLVLHEIDADAAGELRRAVADAEVVEGDGLAGLASSAAAQTAGLVVVDPPYAGKAEWTEVAEAVAAFVDGHRQPLLLWYPVKTLTRPNALLARLAGRPGFAVESSPHQGRLASGGLVGSGLVLLNVPPAVRDEVLAVAGWLTPRLSTGAWSLRARSL